MDGRLEEMRRDIYLSSGQRFVRLRGMPAWWHLSSPNLGEAERNGDEMVVWSKNVTFALSQSHLYIAPVVLDQLAPPGKRVTSRVENLPVFTQKGIVELGKGEGVSI